jgi:hypothetical protein
MQKPHHDIHHRPPPNCLLSQFNPFSDFTIFCHVRPRLYLASSLKVSDEKCIHFNNFTPRKVQFYDSFTRVILITLIMSALPVNGGSPDLSPLHG